MTKKPTQVGFIELGTHDVADHRELFKQETTGSSTFRGNPPHLRTKERDKGTWVEVLVA